MLWIGTYEDGLYQYDVTTDSSRRFTADQLCRRVTGRPLDHSPLLRHLRGKLRPLHALG